MLFCFICSNSIFFNVQFIGFFQLPILNGVWFLFIALHMNILYSRNWLIYTLYCFSKCQTVARNMLAFASWHVGNWQLTYSCWVWPNLEVISDRFRSVKYIDLNTTLIDCYILICSFFFIDTHILYLLNSLHL